MSSFCSFFSPTDTCLLFLLVVPGQVENVSLSNNGSHFLISWEEPIPRNGIVSYLVNLSCTEQFSGFSSAFLEDEGTSALELIVMETILPYSSCLATVLPFTGAGQGSRGSSNLTSDETGKGSMWPQVYSLKVNEPGLILRY